MQLHLCNQVDGAVSLRTRRHVRRYARMPNGQSRTTYDKQYENVTRDAFFWPPARLIVCLKLAFSKKPQNEADWGVVDALADLLAKTKPGEWHQGLH